MRLFHIVQLVDAVRHHVLLAVRRISIAFAFTVRRNLLRKHWIQMSCLWRKEKKDRKLNNKSFFCQLPARRSLHDESKEEVWLGRFSFNLCFWVPSKFNFRFVLSLFFLCVTRCSIYISLLAFSRRSRSESFATWCRRPPFPPFPSPPQLPIQLLWPGLNFRFFDIARRSPIP